jgi:hypothetical protein
MFHLAGNNRAQSVPHSEGPQERLLLKGKQELKMGLPGAREIVSASNQQCVVQMHHWRLHGCQAVACPTSQKVTIEDGDSAKLARTTRQDRPAEPVLPC